jgi:hypothetical protein
VVVEKNVGIPQCFLTTSIGPKELLNLHHSDVLGKEIPPFKSRMKK